MLSPATLALKERRKRRKSMLFLQGPLTFDWINHSIPDPASRLILVARAYMDMKGCSELPLTAAVWEAARILGKDARYRTLKAIRANVKRYAVETRKGRTTVLRKVHAQPGSSDESDGMAPEANGLKPLP